MVQKVPPEAVALLRRRYSEGATLAVLKAESGVTSLWMIYRCLDGHYDDGCGVPLPLPALPRRRNDARMTRAELLRRLWRNAQRQVDQIETRIKQSRQAPDDSERDARALAVLVRTLRELSAFDEMRKPDAKKQPKPELENDDPVPRDIDELRRELARRIHAFVDERTGHRGPGGPEA